jgi:hypothetical protein
VRHALTTKAGIAAVLVVLALAGVPALLGVSGGKATSVKPKSQLFVHSDTQRAASGIVPPVQSQPPTITKMIPFTSFDVFLLVAGGVVLLVFGANVGRPRELSTSELPEPQRVEA